MFDRTTSGSPLKWLSIVDEYTRERVALKADRNIASEDVIDTPSAFLAGGGLRQGHAHGTTDERGFDPAEAPRTPDDLAATLLTLLGFPHDEQVLAASGRPVKLAEFGKPISGIIA